MQSGKRPDEILGNKDAAHVMKFEYCGGWGYRKYAIAAIGEIEKKYEGQFQYNLFRDPKTSGRLEVTVYLNSKDDSGEGILIHSKASSKKYIHQDYETFLALVEDALSQCWAPTFWQVGTHLMNIKVNGY